MKRDWDQFFIDRAHANASMSTCVARHVGAVATRNRRSFADGFNGNLPGQLHCDQGGCPRCASAHESGTDLERCLCVHAEQNLVAFCAANGIPLLGATVYCTTKPCLDCLKLLVSSGVREVVYDEDYPGSTWEPPLYVPSNPFSMRQHNKEAA